MYVKGKLHETNVMREQRITVTQERHGGNLSRLHRCARLAITAQSSAIPVTFSHVQSVAH